MMTDDKVKEMVADIIGKGPQTLTFDHLGSDFVDKIKRAAFRYKIQKSCDAHIKINNIDRVVELSKSSEKDYFKKVDALKSPEEKVDDEASTVLAKEKYYPPFFHSDVVSIIQAPKQHNIWFWGPTGCGKTKYVEHLGESLGRKVYRINCKNDMSSESFFGGKTIVESENVDGTVMVFKDGMVPTAMREGLDDKGEVVGPPAILYIDESAAMPAHIAIGLNRLLEPCEGGAEISLEEDGGRVVKAHPQFRIICSANTAGRGAVGDNDGIYTAQGDALDESLINRMTASFRFGYNRTAEHSILTRLIRNKKIVDKIEKFRDSVRAGIKNGDLSIPFSTRHIIDIAECYNIWKGDIKKALYYTVIENLPEDEKECYNEFGRVVFNEDIANYMNSSDMDYM